MDGYSLRVAGVSDAAGIGEWSETVQSATDIDVNCGDPADMTIFRARRDTYVAQPPCTLALPLLPRSATHLRTCALFALFAFPTESLLLATVRRLQSEIQSCLIRCVVGGARKRQF